MLLSYVETLFLLVKQTKGQAEFIMVHSCYPLHLLCLFVFLSKDSLQLFFNPLLCSILSSQGLTWILQHSSLFQWILTSIQVMEKLVQYLEGRKAEDPIPNNVITEVNPFSIEPWNSPENVWYLYKEGPRSPKGEYEIKATSSGYWRPTNDLRILIGTRTIGRKTTLEFCKGASFGERTGWMMYEYQAEQNLLNGYNCPKDYSSLCRVFLQTDRGTSRGELNHSASAGNPGSDYVEHLLLNLLEQEESNLSSRVSVNSSQTIAGKDEAQSALSSRRPDEPVPENFAENVYGTCDFSKGEFVELKDLYSPETSSSSSVNSSRMSVNVDEYFDPDALLRDIENDPGLGAEEEHTYCRFSVVEPVESNQVIIRPSPPGSINRNDDLAIEESKTHKTASHQVRNGLTFRPGHSLSTDEMQQNGKTCTASRSQDSQANQIADSSQRHRTSQGNGLNSIHKIATMMLLWIILI